MNLARLAFALGIASILLWPLSYAWIPSAGNNPAWVSILVPIAELGAFACAIGAILLGFRARQSGETTLAATWAPRLGATTVVLMGVAFALVAMFYR